MARSGIDVGRIVQGDSRHVPGHVADVVRAAAALVFVGDLLLSLELVDLHDHAGLGNLHLALQRLCQRLVCFGPRGHAHDLHVGVHRFCHGLVHMTWPCRAENSRGDFSTRHERRALRHVVANRPQILDVRVVGLAKVVPNGCRRRHHVRLIAAIAIHRVRPLLQTQMLATIVPADIHQRRRIERGLAAPRCTGCMRTLALEQVLDRDEAVARTVAPVHVHVAADVCKERNVHVLERALSHVVRLGAEQFFRNTRPETKRAREMVALHDLLHGERRGDIQRHARVVAFAVSRRARNYRLMPGDTGLLRRLWNVVDVRPERDDRLARAPTRHPRRRNAGQILLHREAVLLQDVRQILRRLEFLESEFTEAEHLIDHLLREGRHVVDVGHNFLLVAVQLWRHGRCRPCCSGPRRRGPRSALLSVERWRRNGHRRTERRSLCPHS